MCTVLWVIFTGANFCYSACNVFIKRKFCILSFVSTKVLDHTSHSAIHSKLFLKVLHVKAMVVKATMPTKAFGLLYLLKSCHARGTDPFTVFILYNHLVPVA